MAEIPPRPRDFVSNFGPGSRLGDRATKTRKFRPKNENSRVHNLTLISNNLLGRRRAQRALFRTNFGRGPRSRSRHGEEPAQTSRFWLPDRVGFEARFWGHFSENFSILDQILTLRHRDDPALTSTYDNFSEPMILRVKFRTSCDIPLRPRDLGSDSWTLPDGSVSPVGHHEAGSRKWSLTTMLSCVSREA
jgi:hypothetical protein